MSEKAKVGEEQPKKPSLRALRLKREELNEEYRFLGAEANAGNGAAQSRRSEIARELRAISTTLHLREPDVQITVPRSTSGHPFRVGEQEFWPGTVTVKASVAQHLMEMIDRNRAGEIARMQQNGQQVDLGAIGGKATQLEEREF